MEVINDAAHVFKYNRSLLKVLKVKSKSRKSLYILALQPKQRPFTALILSSAPNPVSLASIDSDYYERKRLSRVMDAVTHYFIIKPKPGHTIFS